MLSLRSTTSPMLLALVLLAGTVGTALANSKPLPVDGPLYRDGLLYVDADAESLVVPRADEAVAYRLPNNTRPIAYAVHLTTNVHTQIDFNFTGTVAITLEALESTRNITLHHRFLTIVSAQLVAINNPSVQIALENTPVYTEANNQLTYTLASAAPALVAGQRYLLTITYAGELRKDEAGFYRSSYLDDNNNRRWLATTQFESTDARHGFPCYDEPSLRALFTIKITHGRGYHAISNMPAIAEPEISGETATTTFLETPPTPTYLIAFIVSDFASVQASNEKGFVQRVFSRPNAIQDGQFGLTTGIKVLDAMEKYFGIDFALPKMDQVAVPDFAAGAMENWGLVTYREAYLLFSEARSTFVNKRQIATIVAHEYAHQWFGNLVTPKWWTYLWLNEGFATLFEHYATDWVFPEWKILDAFVAITLQNVMITDSINTTRPMSYYVDHQTSISRLFDSVAYAKSGSVLRMFLNAFTEESFRKALTSYLTLKTNSDATEEDLFAAIETAVKADRTLAAELSVATIMSSWTQQAGYPIVTVKRDYTAANAAIVTLSQQRYFSDPQAAETSGTWWIPYNLASSAAFNFDTTSATHWLSTKTGTVNVADLKATDWFLLNKRQTGYYRVEYDQKNYELLGAALLAKHNDIHLVSRAQLLDDAFDLVRSGRHSYEVPLELAKYLAAETEYVPWASAWRALNLIDRLHSGSTKFDAYKAHVQKLISKLYTEVGLSAPIGTEEHHYRKQARRQAIQMACEYGHERCLAETAIKFAAYLNGTLAIHQDERSAVLSNGARNATDEQSQKLMQLLQSESDQDQRYRLIDALAWSENPKNLKEFLQTTTGSEHRWNGQEERYTAFSQVASRPTGVLVALEFLRTNLDDVRNQYGDRLTNSAFDRLAERVNSPILKTKFNELLSDARLKAYVEAATYDRVQKTVNDNDEWIAKHQKVIDQWIEKNGAATYVVSTLLMVVMVIVSQLF